MENGLNVTLKRTVDTDKKLPAYNMQESGEKSDIVNLSQIELRRGVELTGLSLKNQQIVCSASDFGEVAIPA